MMSPDPCGNGAMCDGLAPAYGKSCSKLLILLKLIELWRNTMSFAVNISIDNIREEQLREIQERRPDVPRSVSEAVKFLLFECMEKSTKNAGVKNP